MSFLFSVQESWILKLTSQPLYCQNHCFLFYPLREPGTYDLKFLGQVSVQELCYMCFPVTCYVVAKQKLQCLLISVETQNLNEERPSL